jgi:transposase InsO family protein
LPSSYPDERAQTVTSFLERALAFFERQGIVAQRLMTDNAFSYVKNRSLRELLAARGIKHLTTEPYRPRTNGKVEHYNHRRPHSAIGDRPPISRVHNVRG